MFSAGTDIDFPEDESIDPAYRGKRLSVGMYVDGHGVSYNVDGEIITDPGALAHLRTTSLIPEAFAE